MTYFKKDKNGFSLLEVIFAVLIITIGIIGAANLINYSISQVVVSRSQIIATNLAQEGLEVIRAIRDNNWLQDLDPWSTNLIGGAIDCTSGCRVEYNSSGLISLGTNLPLKIDSSGVYQYSSGTDTLFRRKIILTGIGAPVNEIKVVSEVSWSQRGRSFVISAEDHLYNWK